MAKKEKEGILELVKSLSIAIVLALIFRSFAFEPFYIPSGSMKPTLLVGDYVFVSKYSYGYSRYSFPFGFDFFEGRAMEGRQPQRGDVVVFKLPTDTSINYIKRLIGLPGDTIQVQDGVLYINGEAVTKRRIANFREEVNGQEIEIPQYVETLPNGVWYRVLDEDPEGGLDNTGVYTVPPKHYFFMGDNRDNSQDSRVMNHVGYVPEENLLGPTNLIFFSTTSSLFQFWNWFSGLKTDRFFHSVQYGEAK